MEPKNQEKEIFNIVRRAKSFNHAFRGIWVFIRTTKNAWIHLVVGILVIIFGFYFHLNAIEWIGLILAIGFVLTAEAFNTAIEFDMDLTSPEYHPYARDTKDVAAGAVLLASIFSAIVGLIIFLPKIYSLFI